MEISLVSDSSIKIKGKSASLVVDPFSKLKSGKVAGDGVLVLSSEAALPDLANIEGARLLIAGPGDYEVGGVKISATASGRGPLTYSVVVDALELFLGNAEGIAKAHDKAREYSVVVVFADKPVESSLITSLAPKGLVLYGEFAASVAKGFAAQKTSTLQKVQFAADKLPSEMEIAVLG